MVLEERDVSFAGEGVLPGDHIFEQQPGCDTLGDDARCLAGEKGNILVYGKRMQKMQLH